MKKSKDITTKAGEAITLLGEQIKEIGRAHV